MVVVIIFKILNKYIKKKYTITIIMLLVFLKTFKRKFGFAENGNLSRHTNSLQT